MIWSFLIFFRITTFLSSRKGYLRHWKNQRTSDTLKHENVEYKLFCENRAQWYFCRNGVLFRSNHSHLADNLLLLRALLSEMELGHYFNYNTILSRLQLFLVPLHAVPSKFLAQNANHQLQTRHWGRPEQGHDRQNLDRNRGL